jgi:NAD(P)H-dependent FMN reductase
MKILAINGSYRGEKGQTSAFLELLFSGAREAGAECEEIALSKQKINRCLGCDTCHTPEHYLKCVYTDKDDTARIFEKIAGADLLIYATPIYVFGISSLLKSFLDRLYGISDVYKMCVTHSGLMFHHVEQAICSKPFVSFVCCDNMEDLTPQNVQDYFKNFSRFMDAPRVGVLTRNCVRFFENANKPEINENFPKIAEVVEAYKQAGRELASSGSIRPKTQKRANQEIVPIPFFGFIKRLKVIKPVMIQKAKEMLPTILHG